MRPVHGLYGCSVWSVRSVYAFYAGAAGVADAWFILTRNARQVSLWQ